MSVKNHFTKTIQIVALIAIIEAFTQVSLKKGSTLVNENNRSKYLIYGMIGYSLICCLLWKNFSFDGMGQVNLLWSCISIVTAFIAGFILFKEPIKRYTGYSVVFALIAVYFSYLSDVVNEV